MATVETPSLVQALEVGTQITNAASVSKWATLVSLASPMLSIAATVLSAHYGVDLGVSQQAVNGIAAAVSALGVGVGQLLHIVSNPNAGVKV